MGFTATASLDPAAFGMPVIEGGVDIDIDIEVEWSGSPRRGTRRLNARSGSEANERPR
jgi:hypothetical protein